MFDKVLVANRGEIAIRVMRTLEELGVGSVGVYSEPDRDAPHARRAEESYLLGGGAAAESYLNVEKLLEVARRSGAQAVHPGYGFLAENADFARACEDAGFTWIGPPADAIDAMGTKTRARELMKEAGVPIVPGTTDPVEDVDAARKIIDGSIGYPVAIKAAGGGGGKGFRVAETEDDLEKAFEGAAREGDRFFSDATVYLERYLPDPRHVEVQVLADSHGNVIHLFERDCSVQRRHQKVVEESPAPAVGPGLRERIGKIGVDAARAVNYRSAGTMEGLLQDGEYFFLEMNTRVQVEHCVTEMVTGIDIVREQIKVAAGEELSFGQDDVVMRGHAIECRINAEDASKNFAPAPGRIGTYREPGGPFVRVDSGAEAGYEVLPLYDPMIAKLIVWDTDREASTRRMLRALDEYEIDGVKTLIGFHEALLATRQWRAGETCRDLMEDREWLEQLAPSGAGGEPAASEADEAPKVERDYAVEVSGRKFEVKVIGATAANGAGRAEPAKKPPRRGKRDKDGGGGPNEVTAPLQGNMWKVHVKEGDTVEVGQLLCVIEAMKMENEITAHKAGTVAELPIEEGKPISSGDPIAVIE
ncbi:MAG: acetyl-CoA carboxylase biotin carboxylase subunit [Actinomycetota bacterium]|nr:acetyl-CoA carboxylase biotin carboxylase subunit [Actinomycetota bacterium]MDQ3719920.1 acetyl-CoA carboxylase biotin carboxylase subunit [Actinomycetota bacterium]